jgi:hypothetical protein
MKVVAEGVRRMSELMVGLVVEGKLCKKDDNSDIRYHRY